MNPFAVEGMTMLVVEIVLLAVKIYAFVSALRFSDEAYRTAGKLNKVAWPSSWAWASPSDRARRVASQSDQSGHDDRGAGLPC